MFSSVMRARYNNVIFYSCLAGTIIMMVVMFITGRPLKTATTPGGILSLEFANTRTEVKEILLAWEKTSMEKPAVIDAAKLNTYLDFIFLFFYSLFLYSCCLRLAGKAGQGNSFSKISRRIAPLALVAGGLDIVENAGILKSLQGAPTDSVAKITAFCATLKFGLVIFVLVFIGGGIIYSRWFSHRPGQN